MKGQYRIVGEVLLFTIGIAITSFVLISLNTVQNTLLQRGTESQLSTVSNSLNLAIVKASLNENTSIKLELPDEVSGSEYLITFSGDQYAACSEGYSNCKITISSYGIPVSTSQQLFNITQSYSIMGWSSSAIKHIEVVSTPGKIEIVRKRG